MANTNYRWTGGKVPEDVWDGINHLAAALGKTPRSLIPEIIERGLEAMCAELSGRDKTVEIRLWLQIKQIERSNHIREMIDRLAYEALSTQSESAMEVFESYCKELELDPVDILAQTDITRGPKPIEMQANGTSVSSCQNWLLSFMEPGAEYEASDIKTNAESIGFSTYALGEAKRKLGIRSSKLGGKTWRWTLPGEQVKQPVSIADKISIER